ncbi:hypothetical protein NCT2013_08690 [Enterobacter sp. M4-VN]|nr:hypothetical protein NCT2013_08690 [Enterobacter sp. M4-VN]
MTKFKSLIGLYENGDDLAISKIRLLHRKAIKKLINKIF